MSSPSRSQDNLADVVEMLLDKGVVINADIAVSVGDTELLGIKLRAAIASFETAAQYGLEFPDGTDMQRVEEVSGRRAIDVSGETEHAAPVTLDDTPAGDGDDPSGESAEDSPKNADDDPEETAEQPAEVEVSDDDD